MANNPSIERSANLGPNTLDWLRSLYFSLLGSSLLTFFLKLSVMDNWSRAGFAFGCILFLIGLYNAVKIANRFKTYEKGYPSADSPSQKPHEYYLEKENQTIELYKTRGTKRNIPLQHFTFYTIWIPAFIFVIVAAANLEKGGSDSSAEMKGIITNTNGKIEQIDNQIRSINQGDDEIKRLNGRLNDANKEVNGLKIKLEKCEMDASLRKTSR